MTKLPALLLCAVLILASGFPGSVAQGKAAAAAALRDFEALEPGAVTEAVEWKLKFAERLVTDFFIGAEVTGFLMKAAEPKK